MFYSFVGSRVSVVLGENRPEETGVVVREWDRYVPDGFGGETVITMLDVSVVTANGGPDIVSVPYPEVVFLAE